MDQEMIQYMSEAFKVEDLPNEDLQLVAKDLGMSAIVTLILNHSGVYLYFPKDLKNKLKRLYVLRTFDGSNAKSLARKLDISERTIYEWVHAADTAPKNQANFLNELFDQQ